MEKIRQNAVLAHEQSQRRCSHGRESVVERYVALSGRLASQYRMPYPFATFAIGGDYIPLGLQIGETFFQL